ncbi:lithostathine-1-beta-like [Sebastes fasciatus]|uniref:lithostathine-1-beta-like n=1 Tax=Sebastes fasciatus TaxID=394691 RepID=UPI003D9F107C
MDELCDTDKIDLTTFYIHVLYTLGPGVSSNSDTSDVTDDAGTTPVNPSTEGPGVSSSSDTSDVTDDAGTTPVNPSTEGLKFVEEEKSWIYALEHCYGIKSSLVQITNSTVRKAVKSLLKSKTELQKGVWIGLERSIFGRPDRPWKWISGCVAKDNAPPWNSSLVDPLNNHCGKIIRDEKSQELKLLDSDCHDKLPFICQGKLNCFP